MKGIGTENAQPTKLAQCCRASTVAPALVLLVLGVATVRAEDTEPNDTILTSTPLDLPAYGGVARLEAFLGDGAWGDLDVDIYTLAVDQSAELPVFLTVEATASHQSPFDPFLRVFDPTGNEIANNDDWNPADVNPRIQTYLLSAGTYYVGVSPTGNPHYDNMTAGSGRRGTGGQYALTIVTKSVHLSSSSLEPNDQAADAVSMGSDSFVVAGEFIGDGDYGRRDVDTYHINLTGPARLDVEVRAHDIGSVLDPVVRLRNCADGVNQFTYGDPCGMGLNDDTDSSHDSALTVAVPQAQEVYIMVSGAGNRRYNPASPGSGERGSVGYYHLAVTVTYVAGDGENEPNDSIGTATQLTSFAPGRPETMEIDGFLGDGPYSLTRGDRDFYEVRVYDESKTLAIDVSALPGSSLDPVVAVFNRAGHRLATGDSSGDLLSAQVVLPFACSHPVAETAHLYVMVMGTQQRFPNDAMIPWPGEHRLEEFEADGGPGSTGGYRLTLSVSAQHELCGNEPNDTIPTATATGIVDEGFFTCSNGFLGDALCDEPYSDADMWELHVEHVPAVLRTWVSECRDGDYYEYRLALFNEEGTMVWANNFDFHAHSGPSIIEIFIDVPGAYYVAILGYHSQSYDPFVHCTSDYAETEYSIAVMLSQRGSEFGGTRDVAGERGRSEQPAKLLATRVDNVTGVIDAIDPTTGEVENSFASPEFPLGGSEGLAVDETDLYFVGTGRYPSLYQLDIHTGEVLDEYILWQGSGYYSDAVMLGGELYLMDFHQSTIHVIDPVAARTIRRLRIGAVNGVTVAGGLAALSGVDRLYAGDAFNSGKIYEIDPLTGVVTNTLSASTHRPTGLAGIGNALLYVVDWLSDSVEVLSRVGVRLDEFVLDHPAGTLAGATGQDYFGDFDGDRDVDLVDYARIQLCFTGAFQDLESGCEPGDLNTDQRLDHTDASTISAVLTGP